MRLAIVAPGHPYRGGIAHFGVRLAQELADQPAGHHCLYINFTRLYPNRLFPGKTQFDDSAAPVGFTSERLIDSIQPLSWRRAGRRIREWGAEAILFHWWHPLFGPCYRGISAAVGKSVIKVAICHNVAPHEKGRPRRSAARYGLRKMDGFVLHARSEINEIEGLLPGSTFVTLFHPIYDIFPGEDVPGEEARRRLNLNPEDKVVLYFGIIRPYKGVETLLEAAGQLSDMDNLKLLVVGEIYKGSDRIYRLVQSLPGRQVRLVNRYIPNEEVALWFRASDIVALPYLSATQSGIVPIAYRCLRPVIVTRVGGLPDVVEHEVSGYLVEPGDPDDLARAVRKHFLERGNPDMSSGIEAVCKRLSWERYARELEKFIRRLQAGGDGPG